MRKRSQQVQASRNLRLCQEQNFGAKAQNFQNLLSNLDIRFWPSHQISLIPYYHHSFKFFEGMEGFSLNHVIFSVHSRFSWKWRPATLSSDGVPRIPSFYRRQGSQLIHPCVLTPKAYAFKDFQDFAKPVSLLPANEVKLLKESSLDEIKCLELDGSCSYYIIQLRTSGDFGSSLSDSNAGIFLCLIDLNGDSILQRIPALGNLEILNEMEGSDSFSFQRSSVDRISFVGPKLGRIEAIWIGPESGSWRLGGVSLTVLCRDRSSFNVTEESKASQFNAFEYEFGANDILLGEGADLSMAELRPYRVTEISGPDCLTNLETDFPRSSSVCNQKISTEESMREYSNLKSSLLLYDALLTLGGTMIMAISDGEESTRAFLIGAVGGFLYLLLLQNSVDGLSTSDLSAMYDGRLNLAESFGRFRGPLSSIALLALSTIVLLKYSMGGPNAVLSPQELLIGVAGFLTCKVAVFLAAFRPLQMEKKENE